MDHMGQYDALYQAVQRRLEESEAAPFLAFILKAAVNQT